MSLGQDIFIFLFYFNLLLLFFEMKFCSCYLGWSAMVQCWFATTFTPRFKQFCLGLLSRWDYRHVLPHLANFVFLVETGFLYVGQAGLELLTSGYPPTSASQSAGSTGECHHTQLIFHIYFFNRDSFPILPGLVLNSWTLWILLLQSPKVLGLQVSHQASS